MQRRITLLRHGHAEEHPNDFANLVERGFLLALGRLPSETERKSSLKFLESQTQRRNLRKSPDAQNEAVADFCQAVFALNEFLYVD